MQNIDPKKWFDRMQPQTLQIATWLLYFDGFFALVSLIDKSGYIGYLRYQFPFGFLIGLISVALYVLGGLLMANDLKIGYKISVAAAASPFVLRFLAVRSLAANFETQSPIGFTDYLTGRIFGGSIISSAFDIAVLALLLHTQSREHQRIWYR
jgi:uncharacterized membrane protein (UPF0136 family)